MTSPFRRLLATGFVLTLSGCARISLDPNGGAETVALPVLTHAENVRVAYVRKPEEGPLRYRKNAWWLFWGGVPLNHPNPARWKQDMLEPGWVAGNERFRLGRPWYGWPIMLGTVGIVSLTRVEYQFDPVTVEVLGSQGAGANGEARGATPEPAKP